MRLKVAIDYMGWDIVERLPVGDVEGPLRYYCSLGLRFLARGHSQRLPPVAARDSLGLIVLPLQQACRQGLGKRRLSVIA
jgi:hypothetical protein|tara:strand:- start:249 stop:488 length:240 start_codon:yes stop_codon:yes gene_type:complete